MVASAASLDGNGTPAAAQTSLEPREQAVLAELAREGEARVAFQGLRRRLELHQEALSRTLRRLEREGLVAHDDKGYRLTEQGFAALRGLPLHHGRREVLPVVQAVLPPHVSAEGVAEHLAQRWFRGLRWYGQSEAPGETTLTWLAEPGNAMVRVRVAGGTLSLEVEVSPTAPGQGFAAARSVLAALAEVYGLGSEGNDGPAGYGDAGGFAA
jgi:Mn-dependent DtxR family transcriptional regulator